MREQVNSDRHRFLAEPHGPIEPEKDPPGKFQDLAATRHPLEVAHAAIRMQPFKSIELSLIRLWPTRCLFRRGADSEHSRLTHGE